MYLNLSTHESKFKWLLTLFFWSVTVHLWFCAEYGYIIYEAGVIDTVSNWQAMDALTEEKAEERAAFQARLLQMDSDHAEAIHQASLNLDQALQARISGISKG